MSLVRSSARVALALLLASCSDPSDSADAGVDPGPPPLATSPVAFRYEQKLFTGQTFDTGWQPSGSHVQLRFYVTAKSQLTSAADGTARLLRDPDGGLALDYRGSADSGRFAMDLGFELGCRMKIDYSPPVGPSLKWEGPIPLAPAWDFRFADSTSFTPFLLEGSKARPVHVEDEAQRKELFRVPIPGLGIPYVASGVVLVKAGGRLAIAVTGTHLSTTPDGGTALVITAEGQRVKWPERGRAEEAGQATYKVQAAYSGTITFAPSVALATSILGKTLDVAEFPINIDVAKLGLTTQPLTYPAQTVSFKLQ